MLVAVGPTMPSLAKNISTDVDIVGTICIADLVCCYGILSALVTYVGLSLGFPVKELLVSKMEVEDINGLEAGVVELYDEGTEEGEGGWYYCQLYCC